MPFNPRRERSSFFLHFVWLHHLTTLVVDQSTRRESSRRLSEDVCSSLTYCGHASTYAPARTMEYFAFFMESLVLPARNFGISRTPLESFLAFYDLCLAHATPMHSRE